MDMHVSLYHKLGILYLYLHSNALLTASMISILNHQEIPTLIYSDTDIILIFLACLRMTTPIAIYPNSLWTFLLLIFVFFAWILLDYD